MPIKGTFGISAIAVAIAMTGTAQAGDEFTISGRVQMDYATADADNADVEFSGSELRRARLGVKGKVGKTVEYKVEFNTNSSNEINVEDAYVQFKPEGSAWKYKLGQFKTPNSLDEQTSSRFISVLERAAFTDAFQFNRRVGASVSTSGDNYTFTAGVFGDNLEDSSDKEGYALAARGTMTPVNTDETLVHLGASVRMREAGDTQGNFRYRQRPVTHIPGRIISTGSIAESDTFFGVEAAAIQKNFWVAGEYGKTAADCPSCSSDPDLDGAYVEAGVFVGGKKTYKGGKFNRPKVNNPVTEGGHGAVSFVARYDTISLNDSGVTGGEYDSFILGADWWPTKKTRLGINLYSVEADLGTSTSGLDSDFAALVTANEPKEDVDGAIVRAQFDF